MSSSRKKVIVRHFNGSLTWGYLSASGFAHGDQIELLAVDGKVITFAMNEIKSISYVKDFNLENRSDPEQMGRKAFQSRPRGEGLWLRLEFRDRDALEGVSQFDLGFLQSLQEDHGVSVVPPDSKGNTYRIFVPNSALTGVRVLGWIGSPAKRKQPKPELAPDQGSLFEGK